MKDSQLLKDFKRILNDNRVVWSSHTMQENLAVTLQGIRFKNPTEKLHSLNPKIDFLTFSYDDLLDKVKEVVEIATPRTLETLLYSLRYDTKRGSFSLAITTCSNIELFGVKHLRVSESLGWVLYNACLLNNVKIIHSYCDGYVSNLDSQGGFMFYLGYDD